MKETKDNFQKLVLPNGLTVLLYKMEDVRSVSAVVFVRTGAVFEKEKERGISHLVEHSAFIGTEKYPTGQIIANNAENMGISYNGATSKDSTYYTIKAPYMNFDNALELLSQFLFAPLSNEQQVLKEKDVILSEYNDFWNDPLRRFEHEAWRKRFSVEEHPYSWRPMGKPESIKNLDLKLLLEWRKKYYNPSNMVLSIAGNFDELKIKHSINILFGKTSSKTGVEEPKFNTNDYSGFTMYHQKDERQQITFNLSFPTFGWREVNRTERIRLGLLNFILGASRSSRLYSRLREKERFVYKMFCERRTLSYMGAIVIEGSTSVEKIKKTLTAIREEINDLLKKGVNDLELDLAKNFFTAQALLQFDNPTEIANYFGSEVFSDEEIWFPERRIEEIKKIKVVELNALAKKIFDFSRTNIGILGDVPVQTLAEIEEIFKN